MLSREPAVPPADEQPPASAIEEPMTSAHIEARDDGVRVLTLSEPDKRNAMSQAMAAEVTAAAGRIGDDDAARELVVTGEGSAFSAGADLPALFGEAERPIGEVRHGLHAYYEAILAIHRLAMPTVAAVNGPAVGAGLNLALACDVRLAGPGATFGATFTRIGLHPGGGATWFLVRELGASRALTALLTGESLDAATAASLGLAEPCDDALAASLELAERFAATDPALARDVKRSVRLAASGAGLETVVDYEAWAQAASARSPELQAWVEKFRR
jgi:enoyl-CoA hydratase